MRTPLRRIVPSRLAKGDEWGAAHRSECRAVLRRVGEVNTPNNEYGVRLEEDLEGSVVFKRVGDMDSPTVGLRKFFQRHKILIPTHGTISSMYCFCA